ncbi:uncharacterized protein LOC132281858 [Cornus florida]|uniref:uncharacterized protein LOC132281858 n=1 Tax=Cornus florida TaxID=4283 RepID=UPI002898FC36|nr:uncharacterized protein LOC132281858 [Cornus florida]
MGGPNSFHLCAVRASDALMNPLQHIDRVLNVLYRDVVKKNQLRLKTTIESVRWLAFQTCAFRGYAESVESLNRGNFIEFIKHSAKLNDKVTEVVLENAPKNANYLSPMVQKEVLHILGNRVRCKIREEVGDAKFCILVDEAQDLSNTEQMAIVLRFVDKNGLLRERFFGVVVVKDTTSLTLKKEISDVLTLYDLQIDNMRSQGYDGASNMRRAWNGLQALFLKECPYAYYVHCFAHQLQLALVATSKDVQDIWLFFSKLNSIGNLVSVSPKRHSELQSTQVILSVNKLATGELQSGKGVNQIKTLQRAGRSCQQNDSITFNHHDQVDIFNAAIDFQSMELNQRFSESTVELLILGTAFDPKDAYKSFKVDDICDLARKFYPKDFQAETRALRSQLEHCKIDVFHHPSFQNLSTISNLCKMLAETRKRETYYLIDKLIRLILTLPVSTVTTERAFSAMKRVKTKLRNKMADEFLADYMILNIERELAEDIDIDSVVNEFDSLKDRRVHLQ